MRKEERKEKRGRRKEERGKRKEERGKRKEERGKRKEEAEKSSNCHKLKVSVNQTLNLRSIERFRIA